MPLKAPAAAGKAHAAGVGTGKAAPNHGDVPVAVIEEKLHRGLRSRRVVNADAGKVGEEHAFRRDGQEDGGNGDLRKVLHERAAIGAQKKEAAGMCFPAELQGCLQFVSFFIEINNSRRACGLFDVRLQMFDEARKKCVARSLDDNTDGPGFLLLEALRVVVGRKVVQPDKGLHALPRIGADVRMSADHTGNRTYGAACFAGDVFDGNGENLLSKSIGNGVGNVSSPRYKKRNSIRNNSGSSD